MYAIATSPVHWLLRVLRHPILPPSCTASTLASTAQCVDFRPDKDSIVFHWQPVLMATT